MFKKFFSFLSKRSLFEEALEESEKMFDLAIKTFNEGNDVLFFDHAINNDIYSVDKEINRREVKVRRLILEHIALNPQEDLVASLMLLTTISNIERIGDYSKNIFELKQKLQKPVNSYPFYKEAIFLYKETLNYLNNSREVIRQNDEAKAKDFIEKMYLLKTKCEENIDKLITAGGEPSFIVVFTLYFRYLKRVVSHLINILTTITNPFELVDFYKKP